MGSLSFESTYEIFERQIKAGVKAGAQVLDVNLGLPEIDEREMMIETIEEIQSIINLPLQIDSVRPDVIEAAVRIYNGKPIINSVSGKNPPWKVYFL